MECCICATDALAVIKYTDKLGKRITEPRCEACALAVVEDTANTVHNKDELTEISTDIKKEDLKEAAKKKLDTISDNDSNDDSGTSDSSTSRPKQPTRPPNILTGKTTIFARRRRTRPPYRTQ